MRKNLNVHLLVIDPQNDFCDIAGAALPVKGANADMERLAALVDRVGSKVDDIHVTLDSHRLIDIAHPAFWMNQKGIPPTPGIQISVSDVEAGIWTPRLPTLRARALEYTKALAKSGKYKLMIWPPHCLIGTWGHNVHPSLNAALQRWSERELAFVDYVTKGTNPYTEHYGALMAEVPDPSDPATLLNTAVLEMLAKADVIGVAGEASSHCVLTTVGQIAENIGVEHLKKFHLLTDCMSPVVIPGVIDFTPQADAFLKDMQKLGMTLTDSKSFLA